MRIFPKKQLKSPLFSLFDLYFAFPSDNTPVYLMFVAFRGAFCPFCSFFTYFVRIFPVLRCFLSLFELVFEHFVTPKAYFCLVLMLFHRFTAMFHVKHCVFHSSLLFHVKHLLYYCFLGLFHVKHRLKPISLCVVRCFYQNILFLIIFPLFLHNILTYYRKNDIIIVLKCLKNSIFSALLMLNFKKRRYHGKSCFVFQSEGWRRQNHLLCEYISTDC